MRRLSENTYTLKSSLRHAVLIDRLKANTLPKKKLVLEITDKKFIGRIEGNSFSVISSCFFSASVCVVHGIVNDRSEVVVTTTLNKAYRALFAIWLLLGTIAFIITAIMQLSVVVDFLILMVPFSFAVVFFRLFLHGIYLFSRRNALNKLMRLLEANDSNLSFRGVITLFAKMRFLKFLMFNRLVRSYLDSNYWFLQLNKRAKSLILEMWYTLSVFFPYLGASLFLKMISGDPLTVRFEWTDLITLILFSLMMMALFNKDFFGGQSVVHRQLGYKVMDAKSNQTASQVQCLVRNLTGPIWPIEAIFILASPKRRLGILLPELS